MLRTLVVTTARVLLCVLGGLVLISIAPMLLGWHTDVVLTGSMLPSLRPGDVVSYEPVRPGELIAGQIILVRDPAHPGHLLAHRFKGLLADGQLVTQGDANSHPDSTPVPATSVLGKARLDIPRIGAPLMWWSQGQRRLAASAAVVLILTVLVAADLVGPRPRPEPA